MIQTIVRLEGLAILISSLVIYHSFNGNWLLFIVLLLTPDISMVGYLKDKLVGAVIYNSVHNYFTAFAVFTSGMWTGNNWIIYIGLILAAHVGMDRFFGFGLKYPTDFKDTHMQKL